MMKLKIVNVGKMQHSVKELKQIIMGKIVNYFVNKTNFTNIEICSIEFAIESLLLDISKLIVLFVIALLFGVFYELLASISSFISSRIILGGLHSKTNLGCFKMTLCIFAVMIIGSIILDKFVKIVFGITLFSMSVIPIVGPIPSQYRRSIDHKRRKQLSIYAILIEVFFLSIAQVCINAQVLRTGVYLGLLTSNIQVCIYGIKRRKVIRL